jgi:four helix bundle protein
LKIFDLEERTFIFARDVRIFVGKLSKSEMNSEDFKQLIRSSGSVGANYREANDALGKKDFSYRIRISRKEAKESKYWLRLILEITFQNDNDEASRLIQEADELKRILSKILQNVA